MALIEEPALGLHPDVLPGLRDLVISASMRCQLVLTTHSTTFVDAFSGRADSILVAERGAEGTRVARLSDADVAEAREGGGLAAMWLSGRLGGTRW